MRFRNPSTGVEQTAEPDTKRYDIFERSERWLAIDGYETVPESPLQALTVKELETLAAEHGLDVPANARKARLVEIVRDAGITAVAPVEPESVEEAEA